MKIRMTGAGKNYLSQLIAENLFTEGTNRYKKKQQQYLKQKTMIYNFFIYQIFKIFSESSLITII